MSNFKEHFVDKSKMVFGKMFPDMFMEGKVKLFPIRDRADYEYFRNGRDLISDFDSSGPGWYVYYYTTNETLSLKDEYLISLGAYEVQIIDDFEIWKDNVHKAIESRGIVFDG